MITYSLILGFLTFSICGHAAPGKKPAPGNASFTTVIQKSLPAPGDNANDGVGDYFTIGFSSRTAASLTQFFLLPEKNISFSQYTSSLHTAVEGYKKRIIKDHLLHLYPFHFFW